MLLAQLPCPSTITQCAVNHHLNKNSLITAAEIREEEEEKNLVAVFLETVHKLGSRLFLPFVSPQ